jgi:lipid-A-disaccharide synthase
MKYYLVAGEASGDLHGSNLMKEIKKRDPDAEFRFWGGDLMAAEGGVLVSHYKDRAFMGIWEVIKNLRTIAGFLKKAKLDILDNKPDAFILIDNPGFNLPLAAHAKKNGIKVHYYIAPKVWAWNARRVKKIRKNVDHLYSILPFEPDFFAEHGVRCDYVGNPVVDAVATFQREPDWVKNNHLTKPIIALLPGSRKNEIERMLPLMMQLPDAFSEYDFVVAVAPSFNQEYFQQFAGIEKMKLCFGQTYHILSHAHAAVVTSGTATLETALFRVPQVVCYRVAGLTYWIGKRLVKLQWFGLVNLILNRALLAELLQSTFTPENTAAELRRVLAGEGRERVLAGYTELEQKLGGTGASANTAEFVIARTKNLSFN